MRRRPVSAPNHERWLVSYADFITLLFAFFVVMFASSHTDRSKARRASEAVEAAFDGPKKESQSKTLSLGQDRSPASLEPALKILNKELEQEIRSGKMQVRMEARGLVISLSQSAFFPSGEDGLDPSTYGSIAKVAAAISSVPNSIRAEGHTDSVPIHNPRFRSNWDLSAARAIAVMQLLRERWGIAADRMAVTGYADTIPLEDNAYEAGRSKNRRVDIVILNASSELLEPAKHPSPLR